MHFTVINLVARILTLLFIVFHGTHSLRCYHCYPCESDNSGMPQVCDTEGYPKGQGYHACSFEMGAGGARRKRCVWLRHDPDHPVTNSDGNGQRPMHCHLSPMDDINEDCFCFTDDCNRGNLVPTLDPESNQLFPY